MSTAARSRCGGCCPTPGRGQSRVIQGVIAGIGFLGAGTIIKHRDDEQVIGLTTAASVWMTAAIGVACGLGRDSTAVILAVLAWVVLNLVERLSNVMGKKPQR